MTQVRHAGNHSIGETLRSARRQLMSADFAPSTREATLLMSHVLRLGEATILAHTERHLGTDERERFDNLLGRRLSGEPIAYLLGEREFYGRSFAVDDRVLIPRPETEHLIDEALSLRLPRRPRILDIGTGSGAIALTLALEVEGARVVATDCSPAALAVARSNRHRLALGGQVILLAADLATSLSLETFDLVVSNPPYIAPQEESDLSPEITRFEPRIALFAPPDGSAVARRLLSSLAAMRPGAWLLIEIGAGQKERLIAAAPGSAFEPVRFIEDYAGIARIAVFRRQ